MSREMLEEIIFPLNTHLDSEGSVGLILAWNMYVLTRQENRLRMDNIGRIVLDKKSRQ